MPDNTDNLDHTNPSDDKDSNQDQKKPTSKKAMYATTAVLTITAFGGGYYWHAQQVSDLNNKISGLQSNNKQLSSDNSDLAGKNTNLSKSVVSQQKQIQIEDKPATTTTEIKSENLAPEQTTKITVKAVKDRPGTDFAVSGYTPPKGNQRVVYLTITNGSDSAKKYEINQFSAITNTGEIVKPRIYSPAESTVWNNATLAPGGQKEIVVLFSPDQSVVTLNWQGAGNEAVSVPLPIAETL